MQALWLWLGILGPSKNQQPSLFSIFEEVFTLPPNIKEYYIARPHHLRTDLPFTSLHLIRHLFASGQLSFIRRGTHE